MTSVLEEAFKEGQKLPHFLQDKLAQQLLEDIHNELRWQETLSKQDIDISILKQMAQAALQRIRNV